MTVAQVLVVPLFHAGGVPRAKILKDFVVKCYDASRTYDEHKAVVGFMLLHAVASPFLFFCYHDPVPAALQMSAVPPRVPREDPPSHSRMAEGLSRICVADGEGDAGKEMGRVLWQNQTELCCPLSFLLMLSFCCLYLQAQSRGRCALLHGKKIGEKVHLLGRTEIPRFAH